MKHFPSLALLLLLGLGACGASGDPRELNEQGSKALSSGDYSEAVENFDKALAAVEDPASPDWMRAKLGGIQARAFTDPDRAKSDFLALAASHGDRVTDDHYNLVASKLGAANSMSQAVEVLTAGLETHKESIHLQALLKELGDKAKAGGDSGALKALEGLGYGGGE